MIWFQIAWRNLRRQFRRSLITASAMAVSVGLCMSTICLTDGMYERLFEIMVEQQIGHVQVHHPDYPGKRSMYDGIDDADTVLAGLEQTPGVRAVAGRLNGFGLLGGPERSSGAQLIGIDPEREAKVSQVWDRMEEGTYLQPGTSGTVILGMKLAEDLGVGLEDEVVAVTQAADGSMGNALYKVVGIFKSGDAAMDRAGAYVSMADLQELLVLEGTVHQLTVLADDADNLPPLAETLGEANPTLLVRTWMDVSPQTHQLMGMQSASSFIILGIVFLVASFGIINTMLVSVFERTTELGVMRALGVSRPQLVGMVVAEAVLLGMLSAVGGLLLGGALDAYLVFHGLDFSESLKDGFDFQGVSLDPVMYGTVNWEPIALTIVTLISVSALASVWPAARAAWIRPVDAIRAD
ncbi:MAG: ABC transporter permease [Proteobacteria bacterium]|nr:ABC transporter permease [Pseudomonadota bacterium]